MKKIALFGLILVSGCAYPYGLPDDAGAVVDSSAQDASRPLDSGQEAHSPAEAGARDSGASNDAGEDAGSIPDAAIDTGSIPDAALDIDSAPDAALDSGSIPDAAPDAALAPDACVYKQYLDVCTGVAPTGCGNQSDGCGGTFTCQACQCVATDSCASHGYECGQFNDSCGRPVTCGVLVDWTNDGQCPVFTDRCGDNGTDHKCGHACGDPPNVGNYPACAFTDTVYGWTTTWETSTSCTIGAIYVRQYVTSNGGYTYNERPAGHYECVSQPGSPVLCCP